MKDRQGTKILEGDLVMVWQSSFNRWVPGRVTTLNERSESAEVHVGGHAHISPQGSDLIVIEDPGSAEQPRKALEQKRVRPPFESIVPKAPVHHVVCPICFGEIQTHGSLFEHWEAGHFDSMTCTECGFTYGVGSSHGHIVPPSLEKLPLPTGASGKT